MYIYIYVYVYIYIYTYVYKEMGLIRPRIGIATAEITGLAVARRIGRVQSTLYHAMS